MPYAVVRGGGGLPDPGGRPDGTVPAVAGQTWSLESACLSVQVTDGAARVRFLSGDTEQANILADVQDGDTYNISLNLSHEFWVCAPRGRLRLTTTGGLKAGSTAFVEEFGDDDPNLSTDGCLEALAGLYVNGEVVCDGQVYVNDDVIPLGIRGHYLPTEDPGDGESLWVDEGGYVRKSLGT